MKKEKLTKAVKEILTLKQQMAMMVDSVTISMAEELIALNINTCICIPLSSKNYAKTEVFGHTLLQVHQELSRTNAWVYKR